MWGESQFADVQVNDRPVQSLSYDSHGYIYVSNLINGWNRVKIRFHPFVKKRKLLLMAQLHKPALHVAPPALELAPESGTDWRHD
ncbi:unnamed protein product [Gongylonema pulchrum]|uniref:Sortilin-Vps10 domain-containing protein n=1 Tax=Gongylonema pulchrum TaxID=637853 RepID=A0A183DBE8_9BILA|nr:unnamed protein product [Gongylonema pulchrum]